LTIKNDTCTWKQLQSLVPSENPLGDGINY